MDQDQDKSDDIARETRDDVQSAADRVRRDAQQAAEDVSDRVRTEARDRAGRAKDSVASEMSNIAGALRKAANDMRDGSPQERTFGQIASGLADASDAVRDRDLGQIVGDLSDFARRNPIAFLGGAALAGFAATRFAKASTEPRPQSDRSFGGGETDPDYGATSSIDDIHGGQRPAVDSGSIPAPATRPVTTTSQTGTPTTASPARTTIRSEGDRS